MGKLRFGVVGTGMMGCEHLRNLLPMDDVVVVAVSDPNHEPLDWARLTMGKKWNGVRAFSDHRDLLASEKRAATPTNAHETQHAAHATTATTDWNTKPLDANFSRYSPPPAPTVAAHSSPPPKTW